MSLAAKPIWGTPSRASVWDLLIALTARELRVRFQGTVLGYLWWVARPLALAAVLYFAMGRVVQLDIDNYGVFLMAGIFPWFWFTSSVSQSAGAFVNHADLVKKVVFPRFILPLSTVLYNTVQYLLTVPILIIFVLASGGSAELTWLIGFPILFALQFVLIAWLSTFFASLHVYLRDVEPVLEIMVMLGFYLTPIIYPLEMVPERFKPFLLFNPLVPLVEAWRQLFLEGELPGLDLWPTILFLVPFMIFGPRLFRRAERHFADAL
jgi:ABC-type polysaccharide/polyol phosphate export permease